MSITLLLRATLCSLCFLSASTLQAEAIKQEQDILSQEQIIKGQPRKYYTFNYPSSQEGGKTLLTGIREVKNSKNKYYISGFYTCPNGTCVQSFIYKGRLSGKGSWHVLNYPSSSGVTVTSTNLYGPNNGTKSNIQVVGNYTTEETDTSTIGCLYEGPLDGSGTWTTLIPTSTQPVLNTIAHSTMGNLVVGNYDTQLDEGKAFIYDIETHQYYDIIKPGAVSITAYGIWHNGGSSYTICGGYSNADTESGIDSGYLVDWNRKKHTFSNWRSYNYKNDPVMAVITHFDGITSDGHGGYNLTGDWASARNGIEGGFFCHVPKHNKEAKWSPVSFPNQIGTSGNSVAKKAVIGVYTAAEDNSINGFISVP